MFENSFDIEKCLALAGSLLITFLRRIENSFDIEKCLALTQKRVDRAKN